MFHKFKESRQKPNMTYNWIFIFKDGTTFLKMCKKRKGLGSVKGTLVETKSLMHKDDVLDIQKEQHQWLIDML